MAVDPNAPIAITLTAQEWNVVLSVLAEGRFNVVNVLIQKMVEQAQSSQSEDEPRPRPHLQPAS